jgi:DNA-binding MarR family transcriptional regulator
MSATKTKIPPAFHADLPDRLAEAGHSPEAVAALLGFDSEMFAWHRRALKGELAGRLIAEMGLEIELSQFHALTAIHRIEHGVGRAAPLPATVGLLAEEMSLDPSRASRIASGLIDEGWVRRDVAQDDGRKSVLVLTDKADAVFRRFRDLKWDKLLEVFADWNEADILAFSRLFARYSEGMARVYQG